YDPSRATRGLHGVAGALVKSAGDATGLARKLLKPGEIESADELAPGQGGILRQGLRKLAVARRMDGKLCALDAACTHAGCEVAWNHGEQSWDCPCHGGRFTPEGEVLHGPPVKPMRSVSLDELRRE